MKLPSIKKLPLVPVLVAIFLAIGLILFINAYSKREAFSEFNLWGGTETIIESENKDTDNDGLKDWEEDLYKTDYLNPDTDGDGYLDGEEINSDHNPLVKGPNDKQVFYPLPVGDKYNITDKIFTNLDAVAKSYIEQKDQYVRDHPEITNPQEYMAEASKGALTEMMKRAILYNEKDWAEQANTILEQLPEVFKIEISDSDIKISEDNKQETIKFYAEKLLLYLKSENFLLQEKNLILLKDSLSKNDLSPIDDLIMTNDDEIAKLVDTTVPSSWKDIHKKALKIAIIMRNIFVSVRGFSSDPIKAIVGLNELRNVLSLWESLGQEINSLNQSQNLNLEI
ncbi:MAG: hypothetical protein ACOZAL_02915 [Patescibacteria group bacterium]